jgi:WhiB family redox-sensing transcriptional regulator
MSPEPQRDHGNSEGEEAVTKPVDHPTLALVNGSVSISDDNEWWNHRRCAGMPPWIFYPKVTSKITENYDPFSLARSICAGCSVRTECLEYAKATGETDGFWGGEDMSQQHKQAKKQSRMDRKRRSNEY